MPMNRYEIRDEYSLADPELYRAADKDDPEALLEGVAMAGLVGVLRQLGDLSEFAAEIFHDLHEEVMVTAARGNSLMIRVQQLETDVHSVEKAFLSQTDHSSFFYNAGIDWKANQRVDQNLVAQGNLPRFVMDSYEECRGPPRLFLLDKFDVAGAGACLKRYTDPSFFKLETSATANADVPREKKMKKAKKKGPHSRYGEKTELLRPPSHAKLHHLLLEEPVENGTSKPAYRPKLKRRPNRFPFDSLSGKSYMEQLLKSPSPEHKMLHFDDQNESVLELRSVSPVDKEETVLNPSMNDFIDASSDIRTSGVPDVITSLSDEESGGKDTAIEERSLIGYQSDDVASEIDNYVDAPSTMQPEVDSDSELRVKNDLTLHTENQSLVSAKSLEHRHSLSLDSQSTGDFSISDEGNNSYKKEMSSFLSSDSPRTSAENLQSEKFSADELLIVNASSFERSPNHFDEVSKSVVSNFVQPTSSLSRTSSVPTSPQYDLRKGVSRGAKSDETISNSDDEENKRDLILRSPGYDSLRSGEHQMDGEIRWVSRTADIIHHTSDRLDAISASSRHEDDCNQKDLNQFENVIGSEKVVSKERPTPRELDSEVVKLAHNSAIDYSDLAHYGGHVASQVSEAYDEYKLYTENPNVVSETVNSEAHWSNKEVVSKESLFYVPENNGDSSELSCNAENDGVNPDGGTRGLQLTEISSPLNMNLPSQLHVSLDEFSGIRDESETARIACSIPAVSDNTIRENVISPVGLDEFVEEHVSIGTASLSGFIREPEVVEEREAAMLDFDAVFKTEHDDHHNQEVLHTDFSSYLDSEVKHKVDMVSAAKIEPPLEPSGLDKEEESKQPSSVENQVDSLHVSGVAKESPSPESIELPPDSADDELAKSSRILPSSQLQLLDHDDGKEVENLASSFPPLNHPFSVSVYPNDSLGFIFPQGDVFPVTDQISVDQLHPLPPLPPLQWRTGKLQHASSTSELEKVEIKELLPQETFPPATSIEDVSSSPEQIKESPIQSPEFTFKDEKLEQGTPSLKANSLHATIDLSQEVENEQQYIFPPVKETEIPSPAEEVGVAEGSRPVPHITLKEQNAEHCSPTLEVDSLNQSVDPPEKVKEDEVPSPAEDIGVAAESKIVELPIQIEPRFALKEESKIMELPTLEADRMNHTADPPPKEEQQQQQLLLATQQSEIPSPAVEDEVSSQSRKMILPKTCNPVIGSVAALDKSRLRKVTERAAPQIGKPDERDALLDQIRAKSFNLKPTAVSRPTSIQAPNTNLRVAAILEKANAIRQAFAGSDEDDEDNWSDT